MDNLEKFIKENRADFDPHKAPIDWKSIASNAAQKPNKKNISWVWIAAGFVLILGLGSLFLLHQQKPVNTVQYKSNDISNNKDIEQVALGDISEEHAQIELHYTTLVNDRMDLLKALNPDPEMMAEIDELETEYEELKKELGRGNNDEIIVEAMIENYRLKLEILEALLEGLQNAKKISDEEVNV
jgi:hypothetical protein